MKNFLDFLEYLTTPASMHDEFGNFIHVNDKFSELFNTDINYIKNLKFKDIKFNIIIENQDSVINDLTLNFNKLNNFNIKLTNQKTYWIRLNTITLKNGNYYYIITYDDITTEINYSFLYEQLFNNINNGIIIIEQTTVGLKVKDINPYAKKICSDDGNLDFYNIKINDKCIIDYIDLTNTDKSIYLNYAECKKQDNVYFFNISFHKIENDQIVILFYDVTEIVKYKKEIDNVNKKKDIFISNVSHEIRSTINAILGFIELLEMNKNNISVFNDNLDIIKKASDSLMKLLDDISDITKIECGKLNINKTKFNVKEVIRDVYNINTFKLKDGVNLILDIKDNDNGLVINTDLYRFKQIFNNLIDNSIKFTPSGNIKIGYFIKKSNVVFYVKDTGIGIKDENKKYIFNRFHKIDKTSRIGTGLGLTICKQIVKLLGGDIWFNSTYGKGSNFYFKIPYKTNIETTYNKQPILREKLMSDDIDLTGKKILIVEDIEFNMKLLISYLSNTNATIITAVDGNDALIKHNENRNDIDLILMDIQLPYMDGNTVTQLIRRVDETTPIIAQTAYAMRDDIDEIMKYGYNDLIKKPIFKKDLLDKIQKYLYRGI